MAESFALKVSDTLREYLKEIRGVLQETESEAERELQVSSALEEIEGSEVKVATDVECSRILETLIEAAPLELLFTLTERIVAREELFAVACNPFGSHVLEKILLQLQQSLGRDAVDRALQIISEMVNFVKEDLMDYITHKYATFFARRLLQLLSGQLKAGSKDRTSEKKLDIADKVKRIQQNSENATLADAPRNQTPHANAEPDEEVPPEFEKHVHSIVKEVCGHGFDTATLVSLQRSIYASPFLQMLLKAVPDMSKLSTLICHILGCPPSQGEPPTTAITRLDQASIISQMKHKTASHMVEAIFLSCPPKLYDPLQKSLSSCFASLCVNPVANYAAQSLIAAAPAARNVADIFHALKGCLEDCLLRGRSGVACLLVAACAAWRVECEECCTTVQAVFPDGVVEGLAMLGQDLTLSEAIEALKSTKKPPRLSVNGCILLKSMLSMPQSACRAITDGVVQLDKASVEFIAADPSGARVLETLLKGSAPKPVKRKLVDILEGSFLKLAKLGAASRFVESLFMWCDLADKQRIAQPLAGHLTEIKASKFGEPLCQAFQLELFASGEDEWRKRMQSSAKIKAQYERLFADSIAKEAKAKRKSKKRKGMKDDLDIHGGHAPVFNVGVTAATGVHDSKGFVQQQDEKGAQTYEEGDDLQPKKKKKKRDKLKEQDNTHDVHGEEVDVEHPAGENDENCEVVDNQRKKSKKKKKSTNDDGGDKQDTGEKVSRKKRDKGRVERHRADNKRQHEGEEYVKPATDAKSVVDEVMAELAVGSIGLAGSGSKKKQKKDKGKGKDTGNAVGKDDRSKKRKVEA